MSQIIQLKPKKQPKPKIGVIIQARMSSVRFPGKSMALLAGKPVLEWVIERAKNIRAGKKHDIEVIIAVPDTPESEPMLKLAETLGVSNFCGNELNVLNRYYRAAIFFGFEYIVRITGDCPFIDPKVSSEVLQLLLWRKLDYCSNVWPTRTYPKGLDCEAFTMDTLEAAHNLSGVIGDWEHVTPWMQRTKEVLKANVCQKEDVSTKNWCVDYPEDIARLEQEMKQGSIPRTNNNDN